MGHAGVGGLHSPEPSIPTPGKRGGVSSRTAGVFAHGPAAAIQSHHSEPRGSGRLRRNVARGLRLTMNPPPGGASLALRLELVPTSYEERALFDGGRMLTRRVPLQGRTPLVESITASFLDPNTGQPTTQAAVSVRLSRAHGYAAGEYQLTVRGPDGVPFGSPAQLTFLGVNPAIDRRSSVFNP